MSRGTWNAARPSGTATRAGGGSSSRSPKENPQAMGATMRAGALAVQQQRHIVQPSLHQGALSPQSPSQSGASHAEKQVARMAIATAAARTCLPLPRIGRQDTAETHVAQGFTRLDG